MASDALSLQSNYPVANTSLNAEEHFNLGNVLLKQGNLQAAAESFQQALKIRPDYSEAHHNLGCAFLDQRNLKEAVKCFQQALKIMPDFFYAYCNLGNAFYHQGNLEAAIETYQQALKLQPDSFRAKFGILIAQLPIIYSSYTEINIQRNKYKNYLEELAQSYKLADTQELKKYVEAVGSLQPFYLAYQGFNDLHLQQVYGEMLVHMMSNCYPQWSQDIPLTELKPNEKVRVGLVSQFFCSHSNWKIPIKGWTENLDRSEFELFAYHTSSTRDHNTTQAAKEFDKFTQGSLSLEEWCELIYKDNLHILIFPEFGMDHMTLRLGCLKLAPIQITSWGHPQTSGLPTIDYYLSSDLMEPENAQEHYTEKLVRLPNLSIHYTPLVTEYDTFRKTDIGLTDNEIMFWCCQSLFKYLPQHDDVFPKIAKELTNCKFVFIKHHDSGYVTEVFCQRLQHTFQEVGLNYQDYCIFLPHMHLRSFTGISAMADVFLDSIGWSGCNSTLEAIAHNVPVLTLPGELMRGRHSLGILKMMGIEETIASNKEEYVQIAIRLGRDSVYRQYISQLIAQNKHKLYGDLQPIRALEEFLLNAVGKQKISAMANVSETLRLAIQQQRANNLEAAEQAYRQILAIQPNHPEALYGLGVLGQQRGELEEAEKFLDAAAQVQPDSVKIWFTLGNLRQLQGQLSAAEEAYKKAIALRPDAVSIYNNLGYTLQQKGNWKEAITCYQKALDLQPNCVEADVNLGNLLHTQGKLSPDKQLYYAQLNCKLGLARKKAGDLQTAVAYLQKALELNPSYEEVSRILGELALVNIN
ncbi:MAG: tetratricopeptide repeat protein [Gloeotrichia echinulata DVL01]